MYVAPSGETSQRSARSGTTSVLRGAYPMRFIDAAVGATMALILVALGRVSMRIVNDAIDAMHRDDAEVPEYLARRPRRNLAIAIIAAATVVELVAPGTPAGGWLDLAAAAAVLNVLNDWHVGRALFTRWAFLLYLVAWLMALGYAALSTLTKQAPILPPLVLAFVVAGVYVAWAFWRRRVLQRRGLAQHHAQAWLARGRCPGCGYSLRGLQPAGDGCRVCPECGGAWKISPAAPAGDRPTGTA